MTAIKCQGTGGDSGGDKHPGKATVTTAVRFLSALLVGCIILLLFDHNKIAEDQSFHEHNPSSFLPWSAMTLSDRIRTQVSEPDANTVRITHLVHLPAAWSQGPLQAQLPPCAPSAPVFWKKLMYQVPIVVLAEHLPEAAMPESFIVGHATAEGASPWLARRFPSQLVASCLQVELLSPGYWEGFRPSRVHALARMDGQLGDPWLECNVQAKDPCGLDGVRWVGVPSADELSSWMEQVQEIGLAESLLLFQPAPTFMNPSGFPMEGRIEIDLKRTDPQARVPSFTHVRSGTQGGPAKGDVSLP
jgi:hypothetical protein